MTEEQEKHLQIIKDYICQLVDMKYRRGVEEHGGNLWENPADWFRQEKDYELADQLVYSITEHQVRGGNTWLND